MGVMHAEILAIGDELANGLRLDTNSQWLSVELGRLGIPARYHTTVGDQQEPLVEAIQLAARRADLLMITGGLGPTADDLTRQALAEAIGVPLQIDPESLRHIEQLFARRQREMPETNKLQAMFPEGSHPIPNGHGTAPGIEAEMTEGQNRCHVFALPGIPAEMRQMWKDQVVSTLQKSVQQDTILHHRRIRCFGEGESKVESRLPDLIHRDRNPSVGITVHAATITLVVTARGATIEECENSMAPTIASIHQSLGDLVFGEEDEELQHVVLRMLQQKGRTLATAECGTSGRLAHWFSELPDAVGIYRGGLVSAADSSSELLAGGRMIAENGALTCREQFGADYALAIGPIAAANDQNPQDYYYALATPDETILRTGSNTGHPDILRDRAAKHALNLLRKHLIDAE